MYLRIRYPMTCELLLVKSAVVTRWSPGSRASFPHIDMRGATDRFPRA